MIKTVYVCAPYAGDVKYNLMMAEEYSKIVYRMGYLPICVHVFLNECTGLSEATGDRKELLRLGMEYVKTCDELWIFGKRITTGMKGEIDLARKIGVKIIWLPCL